MTRIDRRTLLGSALAACALPAHTLPAHAQTAKPIRLVVPFAPAGGTDIVARYIAERLATRLGQPVIVDNKPGANGAIAGEAVKASAADGHTLLVATAASFAAAPALKVKLPYNVATDFVPVGMLGMFPLVLYAGPQVQAKTFAEFAALAKAAPGKLNFASAGVGSTNQLVWELVAEKTGLKLNHVPYKGAAQASADVMGERVEVMVDSLAASLSNIKAGKVKPLAVTTAMRQPQAPDIPTLKESGVDLIYPGWASIVAPAGTPRPMIDRLSAALNEILRAPETIERYTQLVIIPEAMTPEEAGDFMTGDRDTLTRLVKATGIKLEE